MMMMIIIICVSHVTSGRPCHMLPRGALVTCYPSARATCYSGMPVSIWLRNQHGPAYDKCGQEKESSGPSMTAQGEIEDRCGQRPLHHLLRCSPQRRPWAPRRQLSRRRSQWLVVLRTLAFGRSGPRPRFLKFGCGGLTNGGRGILS